MRTCRTQWSLVALPPKKFGGVGKTGFLAAKVLFIVTALASSACVRYDADSDLQGLRRSSEDSITLALTLMTYNNPFFVALKDAASNTAREHGVTLIEHDANFDIASQLGAIENFLIQGVDAILLNPVDSAAVVTAVEAANQKGVPVICVDVKADGGKLATFIASDNEKLGMMSGQYIASRLGGKGRIAIVGHPFVSSGLSRQNGLKKVLNSYPEIELVTEQPCRGERVKALEVAENILQAHPDIDAIWAINDPSALGCVAAIEAAGLSDRIFVTGIDGSPEAASTLKTSKVFAATAAQYPQRMGRRGVEAALKAIAGERLPEFQPVEGTLLTAENVDSYPGWR